MKIQYASDLHLEFKSNTKLIILVHAFADSKHNYFPSVNAVGYFSGKVLDSIAFAVKPRLPFIGIFRGYAYK